MKCNYVVCFVGKDIYVEASDVIARKNITMTGETGEITSKDNTYHSDEKHEYKRSGIGVSIGAATCVRKPSAALKAARASSLFFLPRIKTGICAQRILNLMPHASCRMPQIYIYEFIYSIPLS